MVRFAVPIVFLAVVAVGLVGALRTQDWSLAITLLQPDNLGLVGAAFAANSVAMVFSWLAWRALLVDLGGPVDTVTSARIYFVGFLAKFAPGRFWPLLANIRMGSAAGVTGPRMATVYVLSMVISSLVGLTVGLAAAPAVLGAATLALALAALPVAAGLIRPDLVNQAARGAARLFRRPAPQVAASNAGLRRSIVAQLFCWLAAGVQLWLLAIAQGASPLPPCRSVSARSRWPRSPGSLSSWPRTGSAFGKGSCWSPWPRSAAAGRRDRRDRQPSGLHPQ